MARAAQVKLQLDVHVAHQFFLGHTLCLLDQLRNLLFVALEQILPADFHFRVRSEDLPPHRVTKLAFLQRLTASIAHVRDHRSPQSLSRSINFHFNSPSRISIVAIDNGWPDLRLLADPGLKNNAPSCRSAYITCVCPNTITSVFSFSIFSRTARNGSPGSPT